MSRQGALVFARAAALCVLAPGVFAQASDVQLAPSPAVTCLTPAAAERGEPEYPFAPWKRGEGGEVQVELIFTGATLAPKVKVLKRQGDEELVSAVKAHVARFRVPCIEARDVPVRLRQTYVFVPDKRRISWSAPDDLADAARGEMLRCMAANDGSKAPVYPAWARYQGVQGNLLLQLRFTAPDKPPTVTLYAASRATKDLGKEVEKWARKLRLPCLGDQAVDTVVTYKFRFEGEPPPGFRPLEFRQFLGMVKPGERLQARFDTRDMGCPFEVALIYRQPYLPNVVGEPGEPGESRPERRAFLAWLSTLELDLNPRQVDATLGDTARISIPCINIDIQPKEKP